MSPGFSQSRFQKLQTQRLQVGKERLPIRRPEGTLTTTLQVASQSLHDKAVRSVENPSRITLREVLAPALQIPSDLVYQVIDRYQSSAAGSQFPHTVAKPRERRGLDH